MQIEMVKIAAIKVNILRMDIEFTDPSILSVEAILEDLEEWYTKLPQELSIDNLGNVELSADNRRSTYHVHLLHLGAVILLYRRIVSHILGTKTYNLKRDLMTRHVPVIRRVMNEGQVAANNSGRLLGMLLLQNDVYQKCWLVM